jgi:predicted nucleic acid-binding protein
MTAYPDTSFLCSLYREQEHSPLADDYRDSMSEPLHFTRLLEFEFLQSIELQVWLNAADRSKGYPRHVADQIIADWQADVAAGLNRVVSFDMDAVLGLASTYSRQRTARGGNRTLDILHVATAVHLRAREFLTFDGRQKKLARHAGMKVPF